MKEQSYILKFSFNKLVTKVVETNVTRDDKEESNAEEGGELDGN